MDFQKLKNICMDKLEDLEIWFDVHVLDKLRFIKRIPMIIKANCEMLYAFNKGNWYFDWDYDFLYEMIYWKLDRIRNRIKEDDILEETDRVYDEITEALKQLEIYYNPNIVVKEPEWIEERFRARIDDPNFALPKRTKEQEEEEMNYYKEFHAVQQQAWDKFHDLLKKHAQGWWD